MQRKIKTTSKLVVQTADKGKVSGLRCFSLSEKNISFKTLVKFRSLQITSFGTDEHDELLLRVNPKLYVKYLHHWKRYFVLHINGLSFLFIILKLHCFSAKQNRLFAVDANTVPGFKNSELLTCQSICKFHADAAACSDTQIIK